MAPKQLQHADLATKSVPISSLTFHPDNPRVHNSRELVRESLEVHGQFKPLLVQKSTNTVIAGNGTMEVMIELGMKNATVIFLDVDNDQAKRILLADNRTSDLSTYNEIGLGELLSEFQDDFAGTGWNEDSAEDLLKLIEGASDASDLAAAHTDEYDPNDPLAWPRVSIPLSPRVYPVWTDWASDNDGDNAKALEHLLERAGLLEI